MPNVNINRRAFSDSLSTLAIQLYKNYGIKDKKEGGAELEEIIGKVYADGIKDSFRSNNVDKILLEIAYKPRKRVIGGGELIGYRYKYYSGNAWREEFWPQELDQKINQKREQGEKIKYIIAKIEDSYISYITGVEEREKENAKRKLLEERRKSKEIEFVPIEDFYSKYLKRKEELRKRVEKAKEEYARYAHFPNAIIKFALATFYAVEAGITPYSLPGISLFATEAGVEAYRALRG